jgi:hypothetical protein
VVVQRRDNDARFVIYGAKTEIVLSGDEPSKLASFICGRAHIERHTVTPAKARFEQVDG